MTDEILKAPRVKNQTLKTAKFEESKNKCLIDYNRKPHSVSPGHKLRMDKKLDRDTGPAFYYAKDDLTKPTVPGFKITQEAELTLEAAQNQIKKLDRRPVAYDIDYEKLDKNVPMGIINPPQEHFSLNYNFDELNMGPGKYEPDHKLTEKRDDIGIPRIPTLNKHNERQKGLEAMYPTMNDVDTDPVYDLVKPKAPSAIIKNPVDPTIPAELPDKLLYPERWEFYDQDPTAVKDRTDTGAKFAPIPFEKFKIAQQERDILTSY